MKTFTEWDQLVLSPSDVPALALDCDAKLYVHKEARHIVRSLMLNVGNEDGSAIEFPIDLSERQIKSENLEEDVLVSAKWLGTDEEDATNLVLEAQLRANLNVCYFRQVGDLIGVVLVFKGIDHAYTGIIPMSDLQGQPIEHFLAVCQDYSSHHDEYEEGPLKIEHVRKILVDHL